jgi:hypothetical protein
MPAPRRPAGDGRALALVGDQRRSPRSRSSRST